MVLNFNPILFCYIVLVVLLCYHYVTLCRNKSIYLSIYKCMSDLMKMRVALVHFEAPVSQSILYLLIRFYKYHFFCHWEDGFRCKQSRQMICTRSLLFPNEC